MKVQGTVLFHWKALLSTEKWSHTPKVIRQTQCESKTEVCRSPRSMLSPITLPSWPVCFYIVTSPNLIEINAHSPNAPHTSPHTRPLCITPPNCIPRHLSHQVGPTIILWFFTVIDWFLGTDKLEIPDQYMLREVPNHCPNALHHPFIYAGL